MHEHPEEKCEHELQYCSRCDTVYCEKCHREWINKNKQVVVNPKIPWSPNPNPYESPKWETNTSFHKHIDMEDIPAQDDTTESFGDFMAKFIAKAASVREVNK